MMEYKAWEFENDWYISINKGMVFCINQEAACIAFAKAQARIKYLEDEIRFLSRKMSKEPELHRIFDTVEDE